MSVFRQSYRCLRTPIRRSPTSFQAIGAQRSFQSCRILAVGKESKVHEDDRADKVEAIKQEQIKKAEEGKGEWHEDLASDSESIVKADRGDVKNSKETIQKLQQESAKLAEKEQKGQ